MPRNASTPLVPVVRGNLNLRFQMTDGISGIGRNVFRLTSQASGNQ